MVMVQEYCSRGTLYDALDRGWLDDSGSLGKRNVISVLHTAAEIAAGMEYLHSNDLLHGMLTGENVLLTPRKDDARGFMAVVSDCGVGLVGDHAAEQSLATVAHLAPELLTDDGVLSKATDVWSFGVLLWEMYCGVRAYCGRNPSNIARLVAGGKHRLQLPGDAPHGMQALADTCMSCSPEDRPSFGEIVLAVEDMVRELAHLGPNPFVTATRVEKNESMGP
jgi:serine/threonine protein kinase